MTHHHPTPATTPMAQVMRRLALGGWMLAIFLASADSNSGEHSGAILSWLLSTLGAHPSVSELASWHHWLRKTAHFTEYAILALLWAWNLPKKRSSLLLAWGLCAGWAVLDEWHQGWVPHRGASAYDSALDALGAACALACRQGLAFLTRKR